MKESTRKIKKRPLCLQQLDEKCNKTALSWSFDRDETSGRKVVRKHRTRLNGEKKHTRTFKTNKFLKNIKTVFKKTN